MIQCNTAGSELYNTQGLIVCNIIIDRHKFLTDQPYFPQLYVKIVKKVRTSITLTRQCVPITITINVYPFVTPKYIVTPKACRCIHYKAKIRICFSKHFLVLFIITMFCRFNWLHILNLINTNFTYIFL